MISFSLVISKVIHKLDDNIISDVIFLSNMDMNKILDPKELMIAVGVMVVIISRWGMANSEQWAEWAWDDEPIGDHG